MVRRSGVLALVLFVLSASAALACNEPSLGSVSPSAQAGDPVSFSAVRLDPGAAYTILLGGSVVSSGNAGDGGTIAGSFTMPDLGRAGTYYVELHVAHDGSTWVSSRPIQLVVAAPAPSAASQPAPDPAPAPRPRASVPKKKRAPVVVPKARPAPSHAPAAGAAVASRPSVAAIARQKALPRTAARPAPSVPDVVTTPVSRVAPQPAPPTARPKPRPTVRETRPFVRPAVRETRPFVRPPATMDTRPAPPSVSPLAVDKPPFDVPAPHRTRHGLPLWLLLLGGSLLVLGLGVAGVLARLRRTRRRLASLALEAELQELIAEARAAEAAGPTRKRISTSP